MAKKTATPAAEPEVRGTAWLAEYVNEECGTSHTPSTIRVLLRKLVKDGVLDREIGTDRSRYDFKKGANDPIVKAVVKAARASEAKKDAADDDEEAPKRKAKPAAKKATRSRKKAAPEVIEDDFDDEDIEDL